jgi:O-antigen/teichoic acid export membrane protein
VVNVAVNLALLPLLGLTGAGIAYMASACVMTLMLFVAARQLLPGGLGVRGVVLLWAVGLGIILAVSQLPETWSWAPLRLALLAACAGGLFLLARNVRGTLRAQT